MKRIELDRAEMLRAEFICQIRIWTDEAKRRGEKSRTDSQKYRLTHQKAAREAMEMARAYRNRLEELDNCVAEHVSAGAVVA